MTNNYDPEANHTYTVDAIADGEQCFISESLSDSDAWTQFRDTVALSKAMVQGYWTLGDISVRMFRGDVIIAEDLIPAQPE